jgi:hypothetical protein
VTSVGTAPVARALARATTARDVERLLAHPDVQRCKWTVEYDGDVLVTVTLPARRADHAPAEFDQYVLSLDCDSYDVWPPETKFVQQSTRSYVVGSDLNALPSIAGFPHPLGIHPAFRSFHDRNRVDQLICFSFTRGYYDSNHQPQANERWVQGRHWIYSTVRYLYRALQPPYYQGRLG